MAAPPSLTLTYFNTPGRAEVIRTTLQLAGVPFQDERLSPSECSARKASFPYGKVPLLAVDGETIAETQAILRYVGRLTGTYPPVNAPIACALVDEILDSFDDVFERIVMPTLKEQDPAKSKATRDEIVKEALPRALARIDVCLQAANKQKLFAEHASTLFIHHILAALYVGYITAEFSDHFPAAFMDAFPAMQAAHTLLTTCLRGNHTQTGLPASAASGAQAVRPQRVTLSYFDMAGRAEPVRLALHVGGVAFTDDRVAYLQYLDRKASLPNGNLPVLDVDGTMLAQSATILRYAGTIAGLYPAQDALLAGKVDEVLSHIGELYYAFDPWFAESDAAKKQALGGTLAATTVKASLTSLDARISQWKRKAKASPFAMGGDGPTIADLSIFVLMQFLQTDFACGDAAIAKALTRECEQLTQIQDAVATLPRVADWYATRAATVA